VAAGGAFGITNMDAKLGQLIGCRPSNTARSPVMSAVGAFVVINNSPFTGFETVRHFHASA
jgi:hypothetical protein